MRTLYRALFGVAAVGMVAGCDNPLEVTNENNPGIPNVVGRPADLEQLIANSWAIAHQATLGGGNDALQSQMQVMGLENQSMLSNFGMNTRNLIPRLGIDNTRGNPQLTGNFTDFQLGHRAARSAAIGLKTLSGEGYTIGGPSQPGRDARAKMFAHFVMGVAMGHVAMAYDSGMIINEDDPVETALNPLVKSADLAAAAIAEIDEALAIAESGEADGNGGFPLPNTWLNTASATSKADFIKLARSYRARITTDVVRTPADANAIDWQEVIDDAENGITANYIIQADPNRGWSVSWPIQHYLFDTWHQANQFILGMADTTGAYSAYLLTPLDERNPFLIRTPDTRFPSGNDRAAQNASSGCSSATGQRCTGAPALADAATGGVGLYWRNRDPGLDRRTSQPLGDSFYDHFRYQAFYNATRIGPYPVFTAAENDMRAAEGHIRLGDFDAAMTLINKYRVPRGLPALTGITSLNDPVPGGSACVPKVPDPATDFQTAKCGNIMEAMKWEYRMETAYSGYGRWYFAARRWGDLPEGTPLEWPVPYQEMDARFTPFYNLGGVGGPSSAARGTYGL
jgi:hypothetical protein